MTVYDRSWEPRLGPPTGQVPVFGAGGETRVTTFPAPVARLGRLALDRSEAVRTGDLSMLSAVCGRELAGVLGLRALRRHVLQVDFAAGKLRLLAPDGAAHPDWGPWVPLAFDREGIPIVRGRVADLEVTFHVTTGSTGAGDLERGLFARLAAQGNATLTEVLHSSFERTTTQRQLLVDSVRLGPHHYARLRFGEGPYAKLGAGFLGRHLVTFDVPGQRLYLRAAGGFDAVDRPDGSGLHLVRRGGQTLVYSVDDDSPARRADIAPGDEILTADGEDAGATDLFALRRRLRRGEREVVLELRRGESTRRVTFRLGAPDDRTP